MKCFPPCWYPFKVSQVLSITLYLLLKDIILVWLVASLSTFPTNVKWRVERKTKRNTVLGNAVKIMSINILFITSHFSQHFELMKHNINDLQHLHRTK